MSHLPKTQHAFAVIEKGSADVVADKALPTLEPDTILVNVKAIALNPTDWKVRTSFIVYYINFSV
jgi:NADPH:quinone reductase-like Zn-dependent oxidoreductase